jgi:hypothetical protein
VTLAMTYPNRDFVDQPGELVTFGQRVGRVGVRSVVVAEKRPDGWRFYGSSDGCEGTVHLSADLETQEVKSYSLDGRALTLTWDNDRCDNGHVPGQVLIRIEMRTELDGVHLSLVTQRDPLLGPYLAAACLFRGRLGTTTRLVLDEPLDNRLLWDDSRVPSVRVVAS